MKAYTKNFKRTAALVTLLISAIVLAPRLEGKSVADKAKKAVEEASKDLEKGIDKLSHNYDEIQHYLDNYHWKGIVENEVTSGPVTLANLKLNGHSLSTVVGPNHRVDVEVDCSYDKSKLDSTSYYQVVIGLKNVGGLTTIASTFGYIAGKSNEKFSFNAPNDPGVYEIRFRPVSIFSTDNALKAWVDEQGKEPDSKTTIGIIVVSE